MKSFPADPADLALQAECGDGGNRTHATFPATQAGIHMIRRLDMWASTLTFCAVALLIELATNPSAPLKRRGYYGRGGYVAPQWRWKR